MRAPAIRITERAKKELLEAGATAGRGAGGDSLRLTISSRFEPELFFGSKAAGDVAVDCDGLAVLLDPPSAARAHGVSIDFVDGPSGSGFVIENPNKPGAQREFELERDCAATLIPSGQRVWLSRGERVVLTQALGGSYTVASNAGLARIEARDADALGFEVGATSQEHVGAGSFDMAQVFEQLKTVFDPEIPVNVVDLGLIYGCEARPIEGGGQRVEIKMSMTAPGCGMGDVLKEDARVRVQSVAGVAEVDVEIVWDPPWDRTRMSEAARLQLGML